MQHEWCQQHVHIYHGSAMITITVLLIPASMNDATADENYSANVAD